MISGDNICPRYIPQGFPKGILLLLYCMVSYQYVLLLLFIAQRRTFGHIDLEGDVILGTRNTVPRYWCRDGGILDKALMRRVAYGSERHEYLVREGALPPSRNRCRARTCNTVGAANSFRHLALYKSYSPSNTTALHESARYTWKCNLCQLIGNVMLSEQSARFDMHSKKKKTI